MKSRDTSHNRTIGRWGEKAAAQYLADQGYKLIGSNIRTPYGEIDLIVRREDMTVFVEVKTRTSASFGLPEEAVSARKMEHMLNAAHYYASGNGIDHWQIDVISVEGRPGTIPVFTHFENIA